MMRRSLDFSKISTAALPMLPALCARWMPGGKRIGREYVTLNPTRADRRAGSFKARPAKPHRVDFGRPAKPRRGRVGADNSIIFYGWSP
jgi:hypothetical protein